MVSHARKIAGLAVAATLLLAPAALATGTAPSAVGGFHVTGATKTSIYAGGVTPSCDPDGDFGVGIGGYYELQVNGVFDSSQAVNQANCASSFGGGQWEFGATFTAFKMKCGTAYTIRVRPVDAAGHRGSFATVTGSQGAKTLPC